MANVLAVFAQFERRLIGQRTREALAVKRQQGVRLGRRPVLSPSIVAAIRRQRSRGRTLSAIAGLLNEGAVPTAHGGRQWYVSTVRTVLERGHPTGSRRGRAPMSVTRRRTFEATTLRAADRR